MAISDIYKREIEDEKCSCIICNKKVVRRFSGRGIGVLLEAYENFPQHMAGSTVFDKIIGKAAALILARAGVKRLYAHVLSARAIPVLVQYGIEWEAGSVTDNITSRMGTGMCPMEQCVEEIQDPETGIALLKEEMIRLQGRKREKGA